ncbi:guanine nucleotide-binding protein-like 3 homolog [Drosophila elegans]|uniref:guanine nucleotide-binding protein-like 3 homolog n=1 Tax=Drosophila elegans TaxID=30023 RepID=UPI0007E5C6CE|nr:guanine nucleotide-binding protein-like 3 homolog [Drosophila elegans]
MGGLRLLTVLIASAILAPSIPGISANACGSRLQLRSQNDAIDLRRLSEKQLQQLVQQLSSFKPKKDEDADEDEDEDQPEEEEEVEPSQVGYQDREDLEDPEDDRRGGSRPWNRVQRIIRRQLVKIPRRYLKKLLRQFGLARSIGNGGVRSSDIAGPQLEEYYLIPLE